jgi:hypothetical protein
VFLGPASGIQSIAPGEDGAALQAQLACATRPAGWRESEFPAAALWGFSKWGFSSGDLIGIWGFSEGPKNRFLVYIIIFGRWEENKRQVSDFFVGLNLPGGPPWGVRSQPQNAKLIGQIPSF